MLLLHTTTSIHFFCSCFLHVWFSDHTTYSRKSHFWSKLCESRAVLVLKNCYSRCQLAWHSENTVPLPKLVVGWSFSELPRLWHFLGGQATLRAQYQVESRWDFSPFTSDFTIDQVHCSWKVGLLFPFPQQQLVSVAVRGTNSPLLTYSHPRADAEPSCWNF